MAPPYKKGIKIHTSYRAEDDNYDHDLPAFTKTSKSNGGFQLFSLYKNITIKIKLCRNDGFFRRN